MADRSRSSVAEDTPRWFGSVSDHIDSDGDDTVMCDPCREYWLECMAVGGSERPIGGPVWDPR
jgi:hypothetical protein